MISENYTKSIIYADSLIRYQRRKSVVVNIGEVPLGGNYPIRLQSMTTTDTMDTAATIAQSIRMIEAGSDYVRITAPSINEAQNLKNIKEGLLKKGYKTPLIADIHFTPNAAELAARIVEKVRINPGNYVDKKKFEIKEYSDSAYEAEMERIRLRFEPLVKICKEYGTAMRIGTNHGSLSDRIMNRYGDTPMGMVESAMEFLRICESLNYKQIVLSMKSSNPQVMVEAYRLLVAKMNDEDMHYPLHLGVTEAGEAEEGRIKSAMGIGTLLEDGLGDTVRVSLTEEPEYEIPVARDIVNRYVKRAGLDSNPSNPRSVSDRPETEKPFPRSVSHRPEPVEYSPFIYKKRETSPVANIGGHNVPRIVADVSKIRNIDPFSLRAIGYLYDPVSDKWNMGEQGADYIYFGHNIPGFMIPSGAKGIYDVETWENLDDKTNNFPLMDSSLYHSSSKSPVMNFVKINADDIATETITDFKNDETIVFCIYSDVENKLQSIRHAFLQLESLNCKKPVILLGNYPVSEHNNFLLQSAADMGGLLMDGFGNGLFAPSSSANIFKQEIKPLGSAAISPESEIKHPRSVTHSPESLPSQQSVQTQPIIEDHSDEAHSPENPLQTARFVNETLFYILQASRTRISKTEYISCPSCGRTLFDLQETTAIIREKTDHLKGVKIAIMGCIVNGPGEMADADYGYVGTGPGKITLYRGKDVVKRNIASVFALQELINLIKEDGYWIDKEDFVMI